jgi:hypothetical protein
MTLKKFFLSFRRLLESEPGYRLPRSRLGADLQGGRQRPHRPRQVGLLRRRSACAFRWIWSTRWDWFQFHVIFFFFLEGNFSHRIERLNFGHSVAGLITPLVGTEQVSTSSKCPFLIRNYLESMLKIFTKIFLNLLFLARLGKWLGLTSLPMHNCTRSRFRHRRHNIFC